MTPLRGVRGDAPQGYLLRCVGIAPYGRATRVRSCDVSPSVAAKAVTPQLRFAAQPSVHPKGTCFAASTGPPLHKGGFGIPRLRARGTDSHASDVGHWLGMTGYKGRTGSSAPTYDAYAAGDFVGADAHIRPDK